MTGSDHPPLAVLGAGSWGTALAILVARHGHRTFLWGHHAAQLAELEQRRENPVHLPGVAFPPTLEVRGNLAELVPSVRDILIAVPSHAFRATLKSLSPHLAKGTLVAWATKGLEPGTGRLLSDVFAEELSARAECGVVSGPSFAREVADDLPTALTAAAVREELADRIARWLRGGRTRVYTSTDVAGVQLGGAIKNVIAIAAGISDGLGFGANARAALVTRGLAELTRLGVALGGRPETFMGLTGAGDLILTCTDNASRNRRLGLALGRGQTLDRAMAEIGQEVEGAATARELYQLAQKRGVDMPITEQVYRVLYKQLPPAEAVEALLRREPKTE